MVDLRTRRRAAAVPDGGPPPDAGAHPDAALSDVPTPSSRASRSSDPVRRVGDAVRRASARAAAAVRPVAGPVWKRIGPALGTVSPLGWTVLLAAAVAAWLGAELGWIELRYAAAAGVALVVLCALFTVGRTDIAVDVAVTPARVTVGDPSAGRVVVTNRARRPLLPLTVEIPVAANGIRFELPTLAGGASYDEVFLVPTEHRGVYPIGPVTSVRGDPLGMFRRTVEWTKVVELFVRPVMVPIDSLGTGLVRDLEGQTTNDVSMSDLAFHALRDYAPGDDRRYIHWRSSAKVSAGHPEGKFLVRQFLDTRRSHVTVVVDGQLDSFRDAAEFECAVSVGASIARQAVRDEMETTVLAADQLVDDEAGHRVLDAFARAAPVDRTLAASAVTAFATAPDTSIAFLVTGSQVPFVGIRRAASHFPPETRVVAVQVDAEQRAALTTVSGITVVRLPQLGDLPGLMRVVGAG